MYRSYKEFNGYSTAFRQHKADSHCRFIHGYALRFKVWFDGELDNRNWVVDFGCFKRNGVKDWFNMCPSCTRKFLKNRSKYLCV